MQGSKEFKNGLKGGPKIADPLKVFFSKLSLELILIYFSTNSSGKFDKLGFSSRCSGWYQHN